MHTEKVKSNEKRENKLGCAFCISFQYKIKRKFTFFGGKFQIYFILCSYPTQWNIFGIHLGGGGAQKYFLYSFYKDYWRGRVKDKVNLIDDIECKYKDWNSYSWKTSAIFLFPSLAFSYFFQILEVSNIMNFHKRIFIDFL